jgi:hypothetical protein
LITLEIAGTDGLPCDPASLVATVLAPDGTRTTPQVERQNGEAVGAWQFQFGIPRSADSAGVWYYRWETASPAGACERAIKVRPSRFVTA